MSGIRANLNLDTADVASDRLVLAAGRQRYDPTGFCKQRPLRKNIFYTEPYITCKHCNTLSFLDVQQIRLVDAFYAYGHVDSSNDPTFPSSLPTDLFTKTDYALPPCRNCKKIDGFHIGAHDFTDDIEEVKK